MTATGPSALDRLLDWKPPPRRWLRWPWCALRRHPLPRAGYCPCRGVVSFPIIRKDRPQ